MFIYSCAAQLISFKVDSISKEINCAEHEYMNMSPSLIALATPLTFSSSHHHANVCTAVHDPDVRKKIAFQSNLCFKLD